ncbi:hypothetical protein Tco_1272006 [Tanacetum coccineum]
MQRRLEKKTSKAPSRGVVIRETPEIPVSKKKEKVDVTRGKGIELLSQVALNEDAQFEEGNDEDDSNNKQESSGEDNDQKNDNDENELNSEHETDENESGSKSNQDENEEDENDEEEMKGELVKTLSNDSGDEDETKTTDKAEGDEDEEMDYTTSQLYDDVDIWLNEPVDSKKRKTEVLVTSSSHSSDLAAKFLNFSDIPHTDAEIVSPMDVHVHHEVPSQQKPTLLIVPVSVISDSLPAFSTVIPQSLPSFTSPPQQSSPTPPPTTEATNPQFALPNFASIFQFNNRVTTLEKEVSYEATTTLTEFESKKILIDQMDKNKDEDPSAGSDRGLKKRKTSKDAAPATCPKAKESQFDSSKGDNSQSKSFGKFVQLEEPKFKVANSDMPHDQEENLGNDDVEPK